MTDELPNIDDLPVFPLTGLHLFPRMHLPLHIFEKRYRNLLNDTLSKPEDQRFFGIGTQVSEPDDGTIGDPPVRAIAGVGSIEEYTRLDDGRFMVLLRGLGRARLAEELPLRNKYRRFRGEWLSDISADWPEETEYRLRNEILMASLMLVREQSDKFKGLLEGHSSLNAISDLITGYLPLPPDFKTRQMETLNVLKRAAQLVSELEKMLSGRPEKTVDPDGFSEN